MKVIKRSGESEEVAFDKITTRIRNLCNNLKPTIPTEPGLNTKFHIDPSYIAMKVIEGLYDGIKTSELDTLAAETIAMMSSRHPLYSMLAARIAVSNLHKETTSSFTEMIKSVSNHVDIATGLPSTIIAPQLLEVVEAHGEEIDAMIDYQRDYGYDYFGYKTLERSYLLKNSGKVVERPSHMLMRVAIGIHNFDLTRVKQTYDLLSERWFTHATSTLFNAGTTKSQMSSCFLLTMKDDSLDGIYDTVKQCAQISGSSGGIGLAIHNIRATGSLIRGTNGRSNGIVPMLRVFNDVARHVDQGGGKRKGAFAIYIEPWHADIESFLDLRKNHGKEEMRARDLFYGLWVPDLFMKRVENDSTWSLFCPHECPGLSEVWGEKFEELYEKYEQSGKARKVIKARDLWTTILTSQIETGTPYMLYKDAANAKSNQKNLGTIKSSNLCTEIIEYTDPDEVAVCNLASMSLPRFVVCSDTGVVSYDYAKLHEIVKVVVRNLDKVIDLNVYPVQEAKNSNLKHRPVGLGVQGLADVFALMKLPFESEEAAKVNKLIFETMYHAALEASCELAEELEPYSTFAGSPASQGILQYHMWNTEPSNMWEWESLINKIKQVGLRNSLLLAPMPTASTSQILGNNECFEPFTSNIYVRRTSSGEFIVVNKYLVADLLELGLWDDEMRNELIRHNGSVQAIDRVPDNLKQLYKTVWEIKQRTIIDMAATRGAYICQSQSLNLFVENANYAKLTSMHFHAWKSGLKTGMYYLRTKAAADAIKFTLDAVAKLEPKVEEIEEQLVCSISNPEDCESCSS